MIQNFLNTKNSLRNLTDAEFEKILPTLSSELENVVYQANYSQSDLLKDWMNLCKWNANVNSISSTQRVGMKLCEQFFPNFFDIENKNGDSFKKMWKAINLEKVLRWNRKSHSTPYLSELKRGIYFNFKLPKSTMFRPQMAKMVVSNLGAKRVLDPCAGWGGRMLGCVAAGAEYVAFEPNTETYNGLIKLIEFLKISDKVRIIKDSALEMNKYDIGEFDLILTSPPYFDLEVYSKEDTQSIKGCSTYKEWIDNFLNPLIICSIKHLKTEGWSCWNVHNVGKMKMIDDVKELHKDYPNQKVFQITSSKRQTNQKNNDKKNSDVTICYSKTKLKENIFF